MERSSLFKPHTYDQNVGRRPVLRDMVKGIAVTLGLPALLQLACALGNEIQPTSTSKDNGNTCFVPTKEPVVIKSGTNEAKIDYGKIKEFLDNNQDKGVLMLSTLALQSGQVLSPTSGIEIVKLWEGASGLALLTEMTRFSVVGALAANPMSFADAIEPILVPKTNSMGQITGYRELTPTEAALIRTGRIRFAQVRLNVAGETEITYQNEVVAKIQKGTSNNDNNPNSLPTPTLTTEEKAEKQKLINVPKDKDKEIEVLSETYLKDAKNLQKFLRDHKDEIEIIRTFPKDLQGNDRPEELVPYITLKDAKNPQRTMKELIDAVNKDNKELLLQVGSGSSNNPQPAQQALTRRNTVVIAVDPDNIVQSTWPSRSDYEPPISLGPSSRSVSFFFKMKVQDINKEWKFKEITIIAPSPGTQKELAEQSVLRLGPGGKLTIFSDPSTQGAYPIEGVADMLRLKYPDLLITTGKLPSAKTLWEEYGIRSIQFDSSLMSYYENPNFTLADRLQIPFLIVINK